jgi:hypothetical protein
MRISAFLLGFAAIFAAGSLMMVTTPVQAEVACANLPSIDACVRCGEAKYGHDKQVAHCQSHWQPGAKARIWTTADERKAQTLISQGR